VMRSAAWLLPLILATGALAFVTTGHVLEVVGGPAVPLDDTYIHFQYARSIAELHPFRYVGGAPPTPGATSLLWPLVLAPFHLLGLGGERLVWPAWALGFAALALTALETRRLASNLVEPLVAVACGAMALAFGGFAWFAGSGMEVVPFAWLLTRTAARSAEWIEGAPDQARSEPSRYRELVLLAALCPLTRPEGALGSLLVAAALGTRGRAGSRLWALPPLAGPLLPPLVCFLFTGQATLSTALAKWLPLNPYFPASRLFWTVWGNVELLFGTLLDGRLWTSVFLPRGGRWVAVLALLALPLVGHRSRKMPRALIALALCLGMLLPTTYETFLVNRVRYLWPFAPGWFVALGTLAELGGLGLERALTRLGAPLPRLSAVLAGCFVGLFVARLPASIDDLAESSRAITEQQVSLARWAATSLPSDALLGVNDTGAVAYFSRRRTFDVVGLTTAGEARYWTAGAGSRFEHYERLPRSALPTHFFVYPEWFAIPTLLGDELAARSVRHTILGGVTQAAYTARYDLLHSGDTPSGGHPPDLRCVDALDVADLESEAEHGYALFDATKEDDVVVDDAIVADGARSGRTLERFRLRVVPGGVVVARVGAEEALVLRLRQGGRVVASAPVEAGALSEIRLEVPDKGSWHDGPVEVDADGKRFDSMHYWSYERRGPMAR